jgi:hypothetical protein
MNDLTKYAISTIEGIDFFVEAVHDRELKYCCNDLHNAGIETDTEIGLVIMRGIHSVNQAGLFPQHHFKHVFSTDIETGEIVHDWRMSKTGFLLALMSATGSNPLLDKMKITIIKQIK